MPRGSKSTLFLKECMSDALLRLMEQKKPEDISVSEITETAGVGRATWFRNFSTKSEALTFKLVIMWRRWADERGLAPDDRFNLKNARDFFRFNEGIKDIIILIYDHGMQNCIYDAFCTVMMPQYNASAFECYQSRFYAHGLFGIMEEWVKRGFRESADEMVGIFFDVMDDRNGI